MKFTYAPEKLRANRPFDSAEYDYLVRRARECLLWRMEPSYWDSMTQIEYHAWVTAWNELQKEGQQA